MSIDPVTFLDTGNPSYFNRYRYCANDPVNCTDPSGQSDWISNIFTEMFAADTSSAVGDYVAMGQRSGGIDGGQTLNVNDASLGDRIAGAGAPAALDGAIEGYVQSQAFAVSEVAVGGMAARTVISSADDVVKMSPKLLLSRQGRNEMTNSAVKRIAKSMRKDGYVGEPISGVNVNGNVIIEDGHHRAKAAIRAGLDEVPVRVREPANATEASEYINDAANANWGR